LPDRDFYTVPGFVPERFYLHNEAHMRYVLIFLGLLALPGCHLQMGTQPANPYGMPKPPTTPPYEKPYYEPHPEPRYDYYQGHGPQPVHVQPAPRPYQY